MTATQGTLEELDYRPSYRAAAVMSALVFLLYLITLAPSTAMWDTSEYIAAAYTFGLPHPPGNPFFVLLGRSFAILPIAPNVAMRVNILAALCSAGAAGMWFLISRGADRRDGVHRLGAIGRQRKGLHRLAPGTRACVLADRSLVRRS
jgi:hypothetical protein